MEGKLEFKRFFNDVTWVQRVAYLFDFLDQLNLKLQGNETHHLFQT